MLPTYCIKIIIVGTIAESALLKSTDNTRSISSAEVAPNIYLEVFLIPEFVDIDKIAMFVGPGVAVTIIQYTMKEIISII